MTTHLIENGAKKIGLLTISPGYISPIKDRVSGYKKALEKAGIKFAAFRSAKIVAQLPQACQTLFANGSGGAGREPNPTVGPGADTGKSHGRDFGLGLIYCG